jgi:hypothetical protein
MAENDVQKKGDSAIKIAKINATKAILVALLGVISSGLAGYFGYLAGGRNDHNSTQFYTIVEAIITTK